jgi:hypothetical protein
MPPPVLGHFFDLAVAASLGSPGSAPIARIPSLIVEESTVQNRGVTVDVEEGTHLYASITDHDRVWGHLKRRYRSL